MGKACTGTPGRAISIATEGPSSPHTADSRKREGSNLSAVRTAFNSVPPISMLTANTTWMRFPLAGLDEGLIRSNRGIRPLVRGSVETSDSGNMIRSYLASKKRPSFPVGRLTGTLWLTS